MGRRALVQGLVAIALTGLLSAVVDAAPAVPRGRKVSLYLHGAERLAEMENEGPAALTTENLYPYKEMSPVAPTDDLPKSHQLFTFLVGPNDRCAGSNYLPVWLGRISGRVTGELRLRFYAGATPRTVGGGRDENVVDVKVWPDQEFPYCPGIIDTVPEPAAAARVELPVVPGWVEVVVPHVDFVARRSLMLQIQPVLDTPPMTGRVFYDARDYASVLELSCVPLGGRPCVEPPR